MNFNNLTKEEQAKVITNSYDIALHNFNFFISEDIKHELLSYADIEPKFNTLKNETINLTNKLNKKLVQIFEESSSREYSQMKNSNVKIFSSFKIEPKPVKPYSEKMILIFIHTLYQILYFKITKYYEKEIIQSAEIILRALHKGSLFNKDRCVISYKLKILDNMIALTKRDINYFFFQALLEYGTMGTIGFHMSATINKKTILGGFSRKLSNIFSTKRETIQEQAFKLPKHTVSSYLNKLIYPIA